MGGGRRQSTPSARTSGNFGQDHYRHAGKFTAIKQKPRLYAGIPTSPPSALIARNQRELPATQTGLLHAKQQCPTGSVPWPSNSLRGSSDSGTTTVNNRRQAIARIRYANVSIRFPISPLGFFPSSRIYQESPSGFHKLPLNECLAGFANVRAVVCGPTTP